MSTFQVSLVSPEELLFTDQVDQVDLPGVEGDFGVLAGHAPVVAMLRPGIVTLIAASNRERFVVLGGLAEFSQGELTRSSQTPPRPLIISTSLVSKCRSNRCKKA
jgi:F-type H+-transporting ATPase subunit epsilon